MSETIRVVIADDHPVVRGGLAALLDTWPGIEVVAQAADGESAVREVILVRPEVVILDLRMPGIDGVEAARRISVGSPETGILVLSMVDDDELVADALAAGARGYLVKGAEPDEIERAIRSVAAGTAILSAEIADRVLRRVNDPRASQPTEPFPELTFRERDVLGLIARGLPNSTIADRLGIASKTVGNHISSIFLKLGVATRAEAITIARDRGVGA